jgi:ribosomal protein L39E
MVQEEEGWMEIKGKREGNGRERRRKWRRRPL